MYSVRTIDDKNSLHRSQAHDYQPLLIEGVGRGNHVGGAQGIFVIDGTVNGGSLGPLALDIIRQI